MIKLNPNLTQFDRPSPTRLGAAVLAAAALAGCAVGPDYVPPAPPTQHAYTSQPIDDDASAGPGQAEQTVSFGAPLRADWWTLLGSSELDRAVALALANNRTLAVAQSNLARAAEQVKVARGGLYPQIDAAASLTRNQYGASFLGPEAFTFPRFTAYSAGASISYDPDAFGGTDRSIEQASANAAAQAQALNAARLTVVGETVVEALQIASLRAQIGVIQDVLVSDQKTLDLVRSARESGVVSDVDVTTAQSQLDHDRTLLPPLRQALNAAQDALPILVGEAPADWTAPDFDLDQLSLPRDVPLAEPSALVRDRPDIQVAEAQLHAASAAVGVATADLYPRFTLSANVAEQGLLTGPAGAAWSLVGGVAAPIFHGGALSANKRTAEDAYQAAYAQYQQTVLFSFQQVADGLHDLSNSADAVRAQQQALASAKTALELNRQGYGAGDAGVIQVLDTQRLQQLAELGLAQARTQRFLATVNLYLATGAGFTAPSPSLKRP
jgi:NodT family efflux transporter outer membrane factor (OMF) lipoprotein